MCHPTAALGELCHVSIGRTPSRAEPRFWGGRHPWATVRELRGGTLVSTVEGITDAAVREVMPPRVAPGTLLFSFKLSIGKMAVAGRSMHHNEAIAALRIRDEQVLVRDYLFHALRATTHEGGANHAVLGLVLNKKKVETIEIPLPPLEEQRRIGDILNRAASIRRLRDQANATLRALIPALFIKMFGDPAENPMGWEVRRLGKVLVGSPRNGLSPSRGGQVSAPVLTLSAITRGSFDAAAVKRGQFETPIPADQQVARERFLVCRGNGNPNLVGRGHFPPTDMPGVAFPDTMIALVPDPSSLRPAFLEQLWSTDAMRQQIQRAAKTTNGTYKINQRALSSFAVIVPPLEHQEAFSELTSRTTSYADIAAKAASVGESLSAALTSHHLGARI